VPELHIQADAATPYETLARVMALASRLGLGKIGFVSRPEAGGGGQESVRDIGVPGSAGFQPAL
ncbi:MAG: biopolymer transporter ExbD, partial [Candidatus Accumulibacter sp.]|jgi:hypothetical protein|nr:biopolymer transporter ExbD [Accumulibacter sp.]